MLNTWMPITADMAMASVKFKSLLGERTKILPDPGSISSQLETMTKMKIVATSGKNFFVFPLSSRTPSIKLNITSIKLSKKFCNRPGTSFKLEDVFLDKIKKSSKNAVDTINVFVILKSPALNISSGAKCISILFKIIKLRFTLLGGYFYSIAKNYFCKHV